MNQRINVPLTYSIKLIVKNQTPLTAIGRCEYLTSYISLLTNVYYIITLTYQHFVLLKMRCLYIILPGRFIKAAILLLGCVILFRTAQSQVFTTDSLLSYIERYQLNHPKQLLFVHTDKTIYTPDETIWFAGYLLKNNIAGTKDPDILTITLLNNESNAIALQKHYLLDSGLCSGSLLIPDSVPPGNYRLMASTNITTNKNELPGVFYQALTVKSATPPLFYTSFAVDTSQKDILRIHVSGRLSKGGFLKRGKVKYRLLNEKESELKLNDNGDGIIMIPIEKIQPENNTLFTSTQYEDITIYYNLQLPVLREKIPGNDHLTGLSGNDVVLEADSTVVNDTLTITLKTKEKKQVKLAIYNTESGFVSDAITTDSTNILYLSLQNIPKGLHTLTVLDLHDRPLAEKRFFAHFDQRSTVHIRMEKTQFRTREKVTVSVSLTDANNHPVDGIFSISCAQESRIDTTKQEKITSHYYMEPLMASTPCYEVNKAYLQKPVLEQYVSARLQQQYRWDDLLQGGNPLLQPEVEKRSVSGRVYRYNKPVKHPVSLFFKQDTAFTLHETDAEGGFTIVPKTTAITELDKIYAIVNGEKNDGYTITVEDPVEKMIRQQDTKKLPVMFSAYSYTGNTNEMLLNDNKVKVLKTVVIKADNKNSTGISSRSVNSCGDFVCPYGILNHYGCMPYSPAIKGHWYYSLSTGKKELYLGCAEPVPNTFKINSIYTSRKFYGMDSLSLQGGIPNYLSTLFWEPAAVAKKSGSTVFSFYTSDLESTYRFTVQGITDTGDVVFGEAMIKVKNEEEKN